MNSGRKSYAAPRWRYWAALLAVALWAAVAGGTGTARAADQAVIVMYHRFNEADYPTTNIRLEQFKAHLAELTSGKYHVMSLPDIVTTLKAGRSLPDRTVGISIDDAYASVYQYAWPLLKKAGLPFTLFVSTDAIDRGLKGLMTWDQLRALQAAGVTIGHHSASHPHMADLSPAKAAAEIDLASARFKKELGHVPELFAYPYGEASQALEKMVKEKGFVAAFGQHSGVVHPSLGFYYLPRFALNEHFGGLDRFKLAINALALPVKDITPEDVLVGTENPPAMGFTVLPPVPKGLDQLACFASNEPGRARVERLGDMRFEIRVSKPFPQGRTRVNCTLPGPDGRWYWLGRQFYRIK